MGGGAEMKAEIGAVWGSARLLHHTLSHTRVGAIQVASVGAMWQPNGGGWYAVRGIFTYSGAC